MAEVDIEQLRLRASLVATLAAGVMSSPEAWRDFEHESVDNQSFEDWAIVRAERMAMKIVRRVRG